MFIYILYFVLLVFEVRDVGNWSPNHEIRYTPAKVTTIYGSRKFFGSFICILLRFKTFLVPFKPFLLFIHFL